MLPTAHRMRSASDFSHTTRRGSKVSCGSVVAYVDTADDGGPARVGLIVSKSVGNSVSRHRAARRLRAGIRPLLADLPEGLRVVLRALPGAVCDPDLPSQVADAVAEGVDRQAGRR
jgi:ribonuclease P protein component